jgi:kynureninase
MEALRAKSERMSAYFLHLLDQPGGSDIEGITPRAAAERGCQLSLLCRSRGRERFERLSQAGFLCDWREPDVIRAAPVPLYNSFEDIWHLAQALRSPL